MHFTAGFRSVRTTSSVLIVLISLFLAVEGSALLSELFKTTFVLYLEQALSAILGLSLLVTFLPRDTSRMRSDPLPFALDVLLALVGFVTAAYVGVVLPVLSQAFHERTTETVVIGTVLVVLILEALRRHAGMALVIVTLGFIAYGLFGHLVPGELQGLSKGFGPLMALLALDKVALFGAALGITCTVILPYLVLGQLLYWSGGSQFFTDLAMALMGGSRGGSAKIAVVASSFFGMISGSAVANVASVGVITIPLMKDSGYSPKTAGAVEAVASTGGQLMPPVMGASAFLMAEFLQVPYSAVVAAAVIPAVLYYFALFVQTDLIAARDGIGQIPREMRPDAGTVLRQGWHFLVPFAVLLVALFFFNLRAEVGAMLACVSVIVTSVLLPYKGNALGLRKIGQAIVETGEAACSLVVVCAMAGIIIGILDISGLGFGLTFVLVELGKDNLSLLLLMTAVISIVLGMGMPTTAVYFLLATLAAPPLIKLGVDPMAAHMFVMYFGMMSMITPPVAMAAFAAANLAGSGPTETGMEAVKLGWTAFVVPFAFVMSPALLMRADWLMVLASFVSTAAGIWLVSSAIVGFFRGRLPPPMRIGFIVSGICLLVPNSVISVGVAMTATGTAIGVVCIVLELLRTRSGNTASP